MPKKPEHIKDLTPMPRNTRRHNPRNIGVIADGLNEVGAARSIVIDEEGVILAGNGTVEAAAQAGITRVRVVPADGNEIIAVQRRGLTPLQKRRLSVIDNRAQDLSDDDPDVLAALDDEAEGQLLAGLYTDAEKAAMRGDGAADEEVQDIEEITVDRTTEVAWVLLAIPLESWPKHQAAVEAMQDASVFTTMVLRPKGDVSVQKKKGK
jgi:ParB-like chromosome segregation protein Spo0J